MPPQIKQRAHFLINLAYYAAIIILVYLGYKYVLGWILPFILAFCIVSIVNPMINFVNKKLKINHKIASVAVMVLVYGLTGFLLFELIFQLFYLSKDLFTALPSYYEEYIGPSLARAGSNLTALLGRLPEEWRARVLGIGSEFDLMGTIQGLLGGISQKGLAFVSNLGGQIPTFFIAFVFTIMLSFFIGMQYTTVTGFIQDQLPGKIRSVLKELKQAINDVVLRYISAIFKLMLITFVELSIGLLVLGTNKAVVIAAGIAIFDALPLFGTGAILIPWALIELIQGNFTYALGLGIVYAIVTVVRNIIEPHIIGKKLGLNPIVSIVSIYFGYKLMGILGMIAMPMVTQIALELHKKGAIRLFRKGSAAAGEEPVQEETPPEPEAE